MKDKAGWKEFLRACAEITSPEDFNEYFDLFLTIAEKETLASRYLIVKALLEKKMTQREIADFFKVSIAQITRGSNALKRASTKLKKTLTQTG